MCEREETAGLFSIFCCGCRYERRITVLEFARLFLSLSLFRALRRNLSSNSGASHTRYIVPFIRYAHTYTRSFEGRETGTNARKSDEAALCPSTSISRQIVAARKVPPRFVIHEWMAGEGEGRVLRPTTRRSTMRRCLTRQFIAARHVCDKEGEWQREKEREWQSEGRRIARLRGGLATALVPRSKSWPISVITDIIAGKIARNR